MRRTLMIWMAFAMVPAASAIQMDGPAYEACSREGATGLLDCLQSQADEWNANLESSYEALMKRSEAGQHAALRAAQASWTKFRDDNCGFYGTLQGHAGKLAQIHCLRRMTHARACELQSAVPRSADPDPECEAARQTHAPVVQMERRPDSGGDGK